MDDQFEERLIYSSDSDDGEIGQNENNQDKSDAIELAASPSQSLDKRIDDIFAEVDQRSSTIEDDEPIFSGKGKKSKKTIMSSDEDSDTAQPELSEETERLDNVDTGEYAATARAESVERAPAPVRSTLWDSDTSSDDNRTREEPVEKAKKKVLKKKKNAKRIVEREGDESNSSNVSDNGKRQKNSQDDEKSSQWASDTDEEATLNDNVPLSSREKAKQRMSAKVAVEQIRGIQSESQRLARQLYINVPYHKPKQHSLKEFLNRRSLTKQQELLSRMPTKKAAAAIKMSAEELQIYAESLEQRAQEAIEFFQNEDDEPERQQSSDGSEDDEAKGDTEPSKKPEEIVEATECHDAVESMEMEPLDSAEPVEVTTMDIVAPKTESVAIVEPIVAEKADTPEEEQNELSSEPGSSTNNVAFHTETSQLDLELDKMISDENKQKKLLAWSLALDVDAAPKLSGEKNMIIDLESNEVKSREKSGVEELQERFLRHAIKKPKADNQSSELSIFNTEIGGLETISHFNKSVVNADPKPGLAYYKLKNELGKKLGKKRRETILKRLEEEKQKRLEMESDDDDEEEVMEEYSDCEGEESEHEAADGVEMENEQSIGEEKNESGVEVEETVPENEFIDSEAEDDGNENDSSAESGDESNVEPTSTANKTKRSRIIAAFEDDSADEMPPPNGQTSMAVMETSLRSLDDSATDQSFGELPQTASTQMNDAKRQAIIDDMKEFESRLLDTTTQIETRRPETSTSVLFPDEGDDGEISESQLMALCSGAFVTQKPSEVVVASDEPDNLAVPEIVDKVVSGNVPIVDLKVALLSSDDNNPPEDDGQSKKKKKKSKKNKNKKLEYSDDEDEEGENLRGADGESSADGEDEEEAEIEDEELDLGERFVEYDSDENEIEVRVARKEMRKKASEFVEQEAELSESEWGSADEDEKGLDVYDDDLANDEEFDQRKIQSELERIRMRQQIDQDAREVRILKEMYIEDEEDIGQRERKFRWKNIDNADPSIMHASTDTDLPADNEEDENEEEWRRLRFERDQLLLKQTNPDNNCEPPNTTSSSECNQKGENATTTSNVLSSIFRRTAIVKTATNSPTISSPFLINSGALISARVGRKSFLNRGEKTLEKLVNLTKGTGDGEAIKTTTTGKGHYVFVATEKKFATKRKPDIESTAYNNNPCKKNKANEAKKKEKPKPSVGFFELLSK